MKSSQNRINKITVDKLFDMYTYDIDLSSDDNVSIIIAPNGCGKTTVFRFIDAFFNNSLGSLYDIKDVPFNKIQFELENGHTISISRANADYAAFATGEVQSITEKRQARKALLLEKIGLDFKISITYQNQSSQKATSGKLIGEFDFIKELTEDESVEMPLRSLFRKVYYYADKPTIDVPYSIFSKIGFRSLESYEEFLEQYGCKISINYISTNRLGNSSAPSGMRRMFRDEEEDEYIDPLSYASKYIAARINGTIDRYNSLKTKAQNILPGSYLKSSEKQGYDLFAPKWQNYLDELKKFNELGFLSTADAGINDISEEEYEKFGQFLDVYVDLFTKSLKPLNEDYEKYKLFKDIFDGRNAITGKYLKLTRNGAEICIKGEDRKVDITRLSSGEKHDFIMFYNLIFKTPVNGIVLIDEPEISLHIEWQEEIIDKLIEICKINSLQAIVATHSPHIINGHFDLVKEL